MSVSSGTPPQEPLGAEEQQQQEVNSENSDVTPRIIQETPTSSPAPSEETPAVVDPPVVNSSLNTEMNIQAIEEAANAVTERQIEEYFREIQIKWVDNPTDSQELICHRRLKRYSGEVSSKIKVMRDFAYNEDRNNPDVLEAVNKYLQRMLDVYYTLLVNWLESNEEAHPAQQIVRNLLKDFDEKLRPRLNRYYKNALKPPDQRSTFSTTSSNLLSRSERSSDTLSNVSRLQAKAMAEESKKREADLARALEAKENQFREFRESAMAKQHDLMRAALDEKEEMKKQHFFQKKQLESQIAAKASVVATFQQALRDHENSSELHRHQILSDARKQLLDQEFKANQKLEEMQRAKSETERSLNKQVESLTTQLLESKQLTEAALFPDASGFKLLGDLTYVNSTKMDHVDEDGHLQHAVDEDTEVVSKHTNLTTQTLPRISTHETQPLKNTENKFLPNFSSSRGPSVVQGGGSTSRALQDYLKSTLSASQENLKSTSRAHQEYLKSTSREHQEYLKSTLSAPQEYLKSTSREHQEYLKSTSRAHQEYLKNTSRVPQDTSRVQQASTSSTQPGSTAPLQFPWNKQSPVSTTTSFVAVKSESEKWTPQMDTIPHGYLRPTTSSGYKVHWAQDQVLPEPSFSTPVSPQPSTSQAQTPNIHSQSMLENDYLQGRLDGQLNARYMAMFQSGWHETDRKFSGKLDDYPMFRQDLQHHYEMLYQNEPRTLLKKIYGSVSDEVWYFIKSAWNLRNPHEALNEIWEILEDQFGEPRRLLHHSIKQLLGEKGVTTTTQSLTSYRAKLRNLKSLSQSIECASEVENPKLLLKLVDSFHSTLKIRFESSYPDPQQWSFAMILDFIDAQIASLRYRERHLLDISSVLDSDKPKSVERKPRFTRTLSVQEAPEDEVAQNVLVVEKKPVIVRCEVHPNKHKHDMVNCRVFKSKSVADRRELVKSTGRCFRCLGPHWIKKCKEKNVAPCEHCGSKSHHSLLHMDPAEPSKPANREKSKKSASETTPKSVGIGVVGKQSESAEAGDTSVPIMVLTAVVKREEKIVKVVSFYAILDTGAEKTLCSRHLAEHMFGWKPDGQINLQFLDGNPKQYDCMKHHLSLKSASSRRVFSMPNTVFIDSQLPYGHCIPGSEILKRYSQTDSGFPIISGSRKIDMVIGSPEIHKFGLFFDTQWQSLGQKGPTIGHHELGVIWWGLKEDASTAPYIRLTRCLSMSFPDKLDDHSKAELCDIISETHGLSSQMVSEEYLPSILEEITEYTKDQMILDPDFDKKQRSREDKLVHQFYLANVEEIVDDTGQRRLQLPLPWKTEPFSMPESLKKAVNCLDRQMKRLQRDPERLQKYKDTRMSLVNERQVEEVPEKDISNPSLDIHYLSNMVTGQDKFRVVYHGSLKNRGLSLNDLLYRGPMFLQPIVDILIRFRQFEVALCGDIKSMFFQIALHPRDKDMLRVVFYDDDNGSTLKHYRFRVMPFGLKSIPSIAGFCINHTADKNYAGVNEHILNVVRKDTYVDDVITSVKTTKEARSTIKGTTALLGTFGFPIKKWSSNSKEALKDVPSEDLSPTMKSINTKDGICNHKALGVTWNPATDTLEMVGTVLKLAPNTCLTQREALRHLNSHFDPTGLWSPFFVHMKLLYSKIASLAEDWDDPMTPETTEEWCRASEALDGVKNVKFQRWYTKLPPESVLELHLFSDASEFCIGACIYLRAKFKGHYESALIYGKSRNIPSTQISKFSIARKELLGLEMGAQLLKQCQEALTINVTKTVTWVDSMTVIKWCKCKSKELLTFVANRVDKVLSQTNGQPPRYVPSQQNPSDVASRGISADDTERVHLWMNGPAFLRTSDDSWEEHPVDQAQNSSDFEKELRSKSSQVLTTCVKDEETRLLTTQLESQSNISEVEMSIMTLKRCIKAWHNYTKQKRGDSDTPEETKCIPQDSSAHMERIMARYYLIKAAQQDSMATIITSMESGRTYEEAFSKLPKTKREPWMNEIRKYVPFLDKNGILRVGGRLQNCELLYNQRHPAFLPRRHWITERYITARHEELGHMGKESVFSSLLLDLGLWPVSNCSTVQHYIANCTQCAVVRRARGAQLMSSLPRERVSSRQAVWSDTAIDYAGPFYVTAGRGSTKRYLCVFVCMATTAVRVMLARDLSTPFFLTVLRRFLALTNYVTRRLRSDNGLNFVGAKNVMQKEEVKTALSNLNCSPDLKTAMQRWNIDWEFGVPEASHHGGIYERQIRTIRKIICSISDISHRTPTEDELSTCFAEAEYIMNCRPLTKAATDDGLPPLRPRELITGVLDPVENCGPPNLSHPGDELRRGYQFSRRIAEEWWDRWISDYLPQLQQRQKWLSEHRNFRIGDLVILCDEKRPGFLKYPYAIVTDVKTDSDGLVRSIKARMSDGTERYRDIRKVALIDTCPQ